jgi:hypothetical protein
VIQIIQSLSGIGDGLLGLTAVCGMKERFPDQTVVYACHPNSQRWVSLFQGYDRLTGLGLRQPDCFDLSAGLEREKQYRDGGWTRAQWYAARCGGITPQNPRPNPLPCSNHPNALVLCPLTAGWPRREWLLQNWLILEQMLLERGFPIVVLGHDVSRLAPFASPKISGTPEEIAAIIYDSRLVVGVDTGLLHLCGALGKPGIVLAGATLGSHLYGNWPSIRIIQGTSLPCYGCYGHGLRPGCVNVCATLNQIRPEMVCEDVLAAMSDPSQGPMGRLEPGQQIDPATGEVQPWFTPGALAEIREWDLGNKVVLEWGAGASTLWWARRCREVFAIEADSDWHRRIADEVASGRLQNVALSYRPANEIGPLYEDVPAGCTPDIVVIDGAHRLSCLRKALSLPRPLTLIFDNWQQDNAFMSPAARKMMLPYNGKSFPQLHPLHEQHPWQTAIWELA